MRPLQSLGKFVELYGEHFSTMLKVYFGDTPSETFYRCEELIFCTPPPVPLILAADHVVAHDACLAAAGTGAARRTTDVL